MNKKHLIVLFSLACLPLFSQTNNPDEYAWRRQRLMEKINDGIAVILSSPVYRRNGDVSYEFRQGSDFYYVSGFEEPGSAIIIDPNNSSKYTLFVKERNPATEVWTGKLTGTENAVKEFGADRSFAITKFGDELRKYVDAGTKIYYIRTDSALANIIGSKNVNADLVPLIAEMRLIKSPYEIDLLKKAIDITCKALIETMKNSKAGMYEYELQALLEYNFRKSGSGRNGFPSIVGSGPNSCILHYEKNNRIMQDGDLVVMDVGAEYGYYTADVTRTFPVNGIFSAGQLEIYNIVLDAQEAAIQFIKPGVKFSQVDSIAKKIVSKGLTALGLLKEDENVRKFFMHSTSHWLGLDVHDAGSYTVSGTRGDRILEPGMVLTVEPGIYIAEGTEGVDPKYYNTGVRIEDDILVTAEGYEILSALAPKKIEDIQNLMRRK